MKRVELIALVNRLQKKAKERTENKKMIDNREIFDSQKKIRMKQNEPIAKRSVSTSLKLQAVVHNNRY